jgi:hypothetical protein
MTIAIATGTATAYAGLPGASSHRVLATITPGDPYEIEGVSASEVVSVQSGEFFTYEITAGEPGEPEEPGEPWEPGDAIQSLLAFWHCNIPECDGSPWSSAVISWPSWAAYQSNNRSGNSSRSVFSHEGKPLYPYMGSWADGCEVTAVSGTVLIIEWQRGTDVWRETFLEPGQTHVIDLAAPEDGAMIESFEGSPGFSVTLQNCNPQPLS